MTNKIIFLAIFLLLFLACKNTGKSTQQNNEDTEERGDLIENNDSLITSIIKLSETEYALPERDTIRLEKPFFKSFEGEFEGRRVQAYVKRAMISEEYSYYVSGHIYIEGDSNTIGFGLEKIGPDQWQSPQDEWAQKEPYQFEFSLPGSFAIIKKGHKYPLQQSAVKYEAYDIFSFNMNYCYWDEILSYRPHWEYDFQAIPAQYPEKYAIFFKQNPLSQIDATYYSSDYKRWKHNIALDITKGSDDGEDCFTTFNQGFLVPCYLDSTVFVVYHFSHVYMGGAHGLPGTTYFNFDVKTGKLLKLKDILHADNEQFIDFYIEHLKQEYKEEDGTNPFLQTPQGASENFYMLPTGIVFSYYPYELMGFAAGEPELFLSWDELEPFLVQPFIIPKKQIIVRKQLCDIPSQPNQML